MPKLMKCGHAANGTDSEGHAVCVSCMGIFHKFVLKYDGKKVAEFDYEEIKKKLKTWNGDTFINSEIYDLWEKEFNFPDRKKMAISIIDLAEEEADKIPDLTGRVAVCPHCRAEKPSDLSLPFFEYRQDCEKDSYYSGCRGWE